jgi:hypothetical protein
MGQPRHSMLKGGKSAMGQPWHSMLEQKALESKKDSESREGSKEWRVPWTTMALSWKAGKCRGQPRHSRRWTFKLELEERDQQPRLIAVVAD